MATRSTLPVTASIVAPEEKVPPVVPLNVTVAEPVLEQNGFPEYDIVAEAGVVTVTVALPVRSAPIEAQVPLVKVAMV